MNNKQYSIIAVVAVVMFSISAIEGLNLEGIIELPGSTFGTDISLSPVKGPLLRSLISFAILPKSLASVLNDEDKSKKSDINWVCSILSAAWITGKEVCFLRFITVSFEKSGWAFNPVPMAVPPIWIWYK